MKIYHWLRLCLSLTLLSLAACSNSPASSLAPPTQAQATLLPTVPGAPGGRRVDFPDTIIVYQRSSLATPNPQKWTLYRGGRVILPDGTERAFAADAMRSIFDEVDGLNLAELREQYAPATPCAACVVHTLTLFRGQTVRPIVIVLEANDVPVPLRQTIGQIAQLVGLP